MQLSSPNINAPAALANESPSSPSDTITQTPRVDLQSAEPHEELIIDSISPTVLPDPDSPNNEVSQKSFLSLSPSQGAFPPNQ